LYLKIYYKDNVKPLKYQTDGASGLDLASNDDCIVPSGKVAMIPTGIYCVIPSNYEGQIRMRSGLACKGIMLANGVGSIDADFRGELMVLLYNSTNENYKVYKGDRIAQLVIAPIIKSEIVVFKDFIEFQEESITSRGQNGFGHTGV
jgi:dUTP pyrophosphatase